MMPANFIPAKCAPYKTTSKAAETGTAVINPSVMNRSYVKATEKFPSKFASNDKPLAARRGVHGNLRQSNRSAPESGKATAIGHKRSRFSRPTREKNTAT